MPTVSSKWSKGTGGPAGDECQNLVLDDNDPNARIASPLLSSRRGVVSTDEAEQLIVSTEHTHTHTVSTLQGGGKRGYRIDAESAAGGHLIVGGGALTANGVGTCGADDNQAQAGHLIPQTSIVRRLTELECERLQGYPDGWTDGQTASARYRQLGNSVAVPCVEWIAHRLIAIDEEIHGA